MSTTRNLYRSTLVAAALGALSLGVATAAEAHEHGWHHGGEHRFEPRWEPRPAPWYRHSHYYGRDYRDYRDCDYPVAAVGYGPRVIVASPRLVIELPAPF